MYMFVCTCLCVYVYIYPYLNSLLQFLVCFLLSRLRLKRHGTLYLELCVGLAQLVVRIGELSLSVHGKRVSIVHTYVSLHLCITMYTG